MGKRKRRKEEHHSPVRKWRTLKRRTKGKRMRFATIPVCFIEEAGFDPDSELEGNWEVRGTDLVLHIREVGGSALLSKLKRKLSGGERK